MKKILFASTALVAAGLLTTGSAQASDKISLQLGGFSKWWVVGAWNSSSYLQSGIGTSGAGSVTNTAGGTTAGTTAGTPAPNSYDNVNVKGDNEVWFGGSTKLDNGIKVGVDIHLEAGGHSDMTTDTIDKSYIYVEGGFGKFIVGTQKNGTYLLHVTAPDAAGNWNEGGIMTNGYAIARPTKVNGMAGGSTTAIATTGNAEAFTYVAPTFYGLTVGGSYLPHGEREDLRSQSNLNAVTIGNDGTGGYVEDGVQEVYGAGALYANTFGGVGVKVSAGAIQAKLAPDLGGSWVEQAYGSQLSYAGFTLGGSFRHQGAQNVHDLTGLNANSNAYGRNGLAFLGNVTASVPGSFGDGNAWDLGLMYATGPYSVSFSYFRSSVESAYVSDGHDITDFYQLSAKYNLGPGVDILGSAGYAVYNGAYSQTAAQAAVGQTPNQNSGWTVMSGVSLTF